MPEPSSNQQRASRSKSKAKTEPGNVIVRTNDGETTPVIKELLSYISWQDWEPKVKDLDRMYSSDGPNDLQWKQNLYEGRPVLEAPEYGNKDVLYSVLAKWRGGIGWAVFKFSIPIFITNKVTNRKDAPGWDEVVKKYQEGRTLKIDADRREATARIIYEWPSELYAADKIEHNTMIRGKPGEPEFDIIQAIVWAKARPYRRILPWAYLQMMELADSELPDSELSDTDLKEFLDAQELLPTEEKNFIRRAYSKIMSLQHDTTYQWLHPPYANKYQDCQTPGICTHAMAELAAELMGRFGPIKEWDEDEDWGLSPTVCGNCLSTAKLSHEDGRWRFWAALPRVFDLPDWHALIAESDD